jgi:hypothetical protein
VGYSSRYHVASLAAVFLALGVGILIGTGLNGVVSDATKSIESSLRGEIERSHNKIDDQSRQIDQQQAYETGSFPGLVTGLLRGSHVAVIALGNQPDSETRDAISAVVGPSSLTGGHVQSFDVVTEPPDLSALADELRGKRIGGVVVKGLGQGGDTLNTVAKHLGRALVSGGPLLKTVEHTLLDPESGSPRGVDAVIVTRSTPGSLDPAQTDATARLESGILDGLVATKLPVVGIETSTADPSSISFYSDHGASSVDDVEMYAGRVALTYTLGGTKGAFGIKPSADRLLPVLRPPSKRPSTGKPSSKP